MPRRPEDVRAQDPTFRERLVQIFVGQTNGALADRPLPGRVVLRLDAAQPADHLFRAIQLRL